MKHLTIYLEYMRNILIMKNKCELCNINKKTKWYYTNEDWVICDCITCEAPMVVYKEHTMNINLNELIQILRIIRDKFDNAELRMSQRRIKNHFHFHILED